LQEIDAFGPQKKIYRIQAVRQGKGIDEDVRRRKSHDQRPDSEDYRARQEAASGQLDAAVTVSNT
jgi:hypothetical protein